MVIALLSQEGSVIAMRSREGWFQSRNLARLPPGNHPGASRHPS